MYLLVWLFILKWFIVLFVLFCFEFFECWWLEILCFFVFEIKLLIVLFVSLFIILVFILLFLISFCFFIFDGLWFFRESVFGDLVLVFLVFLSLVVFLECCCLRNFKWFVFCVGMCNSELFVKEVVVIFLWLFDIGFFSELIELCWVGGFGLFFFVIVVFVFGIRLICVVFRVFGIIDFVLDLEVFIVLRRIFLSLGFEGEDFFDLLDFDVDECLWLCFNGDFCIIVRGVDFLLGEKY